MGEVGLADLKEFPERTYVDGSEPDMARLDIYSNCYGESLDIGSMRSELCS